MGITQRVPVPARGVVTQLGPRAPMLLVLLAAAILVAAFFAMSSALVVFSACLLGAGAYAAARPADRRFLVAAVVLAFALRVIGLIVVHIVLVWMGTGGALFLDDAGYARIANGLAASWRGELLSAQDHSLISDASVGNLYVRAAAASVYVFGDTLAIKIMNTTLGVGTAIFVYRTMVNLALPYPRAAALLVLVFPSLVLWSALALKDAYAIAFTAGAVWATTEIVRGGRLLPWLIVTTGALLAIHDVRRYVFLMLCLALPLAMVIAAPRARKISVTAASAAVSAVLLVMTPSVGMNVGTEVFSKIPYVRRAMAEGARSAFVEPPPVARGEPGSAFVLNIAGVTPAPGSSPRVHRVPAGTQLFIDSGTPGASIPGSVAVRAGDIVIIETAGHTPARSPSETPTPLTLRPDRVNVISTPAPRQSNDGLGISSLSENIRHLPLGALFLLAAPTPLTARSTAELAAFPEMIVWYVVWVLTALGVWKLLHERRLGYAYGAMMFVGIFGALSLAEGNTGTLVRHRTMLVPFVAVLGVVGLSAVMETRVRHYVPQLLLRLIGDERSLKE